MSRVKLSKGVIAAAAGDCRSRRGHADGTTTVLGAGHDTPPSLLRNLDVSRVMGGQRLAIEKSSWSLRPGCSYDR